MDVILDSNQYLSDVRMSSNRFANLFDYLRRTNSSLVIPKLVFEEAAARYHERLDEKLQKATVALRDVKTWMSSPHQIVVTLPDLATELDAFKAKLMNPDARVNVSVQDDWCGVDLGEVVRRGIERIAPANSSGEQLRDVVLWLAVVEYSLREKPVREVAFITEDKDFWDGGIPRKSLLMEIEERQAAVKVYKTIDEFIKEKAPAPTDVLEAWAEKYVSFVRVQEIAVVEAMNSLGRENESLRLRMVSGAALGIYFSDGAIYEVGPESQFAEINYNFEVSLEVEERVVYTSVLIPLAQSERNSSFGSQPGFVKPSRGLNTVGWTRAHPGHQVPTLNKSLIRSPLGSMPYTLSVDTVTAVAPSRWLMLARGTLKVSVRVVDGTPTGTESEGITDIRFIYESQETGSASQRRLDDTP